jgi:hypothetical protein
MDKSPFLGIKQLEVQINGKLSSVDLYELERPQQKIVATLKRELVDCRLDIRDYELSETRDEQLKNAKHAHKRVDALRAQILSASEYDLFGAVDVAQLTAQLEQIAEYIY